MDIWRISQWESQKISSANVGDLPEKNLKDFANLLENWKISCEEIPEESVREWRSNLSIWVCAATSGHLKNFPEFPVEI